ncbi:hypothetical protein O181_131757, partial [Austropuccinia psidii MF-1]|nr:hypothetical protein [Austropuccinia psidii MF-1]
NFRKLMMELDAVSIVIPNELPSYSLLGKLGGNPHLSQFIKTLIFNEDIIEKPLAILSRLQDFSSHNSHSNYTQNKKETSSSALITEYDKLHKIIFYCSQGKHNRRCTTHKKEECWAEKPHLRPSRQEKKEKNNPKSHLSIAQALTTIGDSTSPMCNQVIVDCGAPHHMFNSPKFFPNYFEEIGSKVSTGDLQSNLLARGIVEMQSNNSKGEILVEGGICNILMYITYDLCNALLTLVDGNLWHCRLGHPGRAVLKNLGLPVQDRSCLTCKTNKSIRLPFNRHFELVSLPLDTIHIDLVRPIAAESVSGSCFLLTIMDQATS